MAEGNALGYWREWGGGVLGNRKVVSVCAEDWAYSRQRKGTLQAQVVSAQARHAMAWNTDTKWFSKLDWEMLVHIQSAGCFGRWSECWTVWWSRALCSNNGGRVSIKGVSYRLAMRLHTIMRLDVILQGVRFGAIGVHQSGRRGEGYG